MHTPCHARPSAMHAPATHPPAPLPHTAPPWTEFLTHACENIIFPQLLLRTVKRLNLILQIYLLSHLFYGRSKSVENPGFPRRRALTLEFGPKTYYSAGANDLSSTFSKFWRHNRNEPTFVLIQSDLTGAQALDKSIMLFSLDNKNSVTALWMHSVVLLPKSSFPVTHKVDNIDI